MNTTEHAANIRAELKRRHGWTARQISVRADYFSMGSAIRVTIKDPSIPLGPVRLIASGAESIRWDERTQEILSGGNRYVNTVYSDDAKKIIGRRYADAVQRAVDSIDPDDNALVPVTDGHMIGRRGPDFITLWDREAGICIQTGNVDSIAETIGVLEVEREANAEAA